MILLIVFMLNVTISSPPLNFMEIQKTFTKPFKIKLGMYLITQWRYKKVFFNNLITIFSLTVPAQAMDSNPWPWDSEKSVSPLCYLRWLCARKERINIHKISETYFKILYKDKLERTEIS